MQFRVCDQNEQISVEKDTVYLRRDNWDDYSYKTKSKIPTLAATPDNLFPSCKDCNIDKKTEMVLDPQRTPEHLYHDRLPDDSWRV